MSVPKINEVLLEWCGCMFEPRKTQLTERSAYGMKHIFQGDTGIYVTEEEFEEAMILKGYKSVTVQGEKTRFCISKRSGAFDWRARRGLPNGWYLTPDLFEVFRQEQGKRK